MRQNHEYRIIVEPGVPTKIACGHCDKIYRMNKDGLPPFYYIAHVDKCQKISLTSKMLKEIQDKCLESTIGEEECSICLESLICKEIINTKCKHRFHKSCLAKIKGDVCPLCRTNIRQTLKMIKPVIIDEIVIEDNETVDIIIEDDETVDIIIEQEQPRTRTFSIFSRISRIIRRIFA
jgi:hypothetical protein